MYIETQHMEKTNRWSLVYITIWFRVFTVLTFINLGKVEEVLIEDETVFFKIKF